MLKINAVRGVTLGVACCLLGCSSDGPPLERGRADDLADGGSNENGPTADARSAADAGEIRAVDASEPRAVDSSVEHAVASAEPSDPEASDPEASDPEASDPEASDVEPGDIESSDAALDDATSASDEPDAAQEATTQEPSTEVAPQPGGTSKLQCPELAPSDWEWMNTSRLQLVPDPVYTDRLYGFQNQVIYGASANGEFCLLESWANAELVNGWPFAPELLAATQEPNWRFIASSVYWAPLFVSDDEGATWSLSPVRVDDGPELMVDGLSIDPTNDAVYAVTQDLGLIVSHDYGQSWQLYAAAPEGALFVDLAVDPGGSGRMYAAVQSAGAEQSQANVQIWFLEDASAEWTQTNSPLASRDVSNLDVAWTEPPTLYASNIAATWRSRDGGVTFEAIDRSRKLVRHPAFEDVLYRLQTPSDGLAVPFAVSHDTGDSFVEFAQPFDARRRLGDAALPELLLQLDNPLLDPHDPDRLVASSSQGFFELSVDDSPERLSWGVRPSLSQGQLQPYLWVDPRDAEHLLLATDSLLESNDGGRHFDLHEGTKEYALSQRNPTDSASGFSHNFAVDASAPEVFYMWGGHTLGLSENSGTQWSERSLEDKRVNQVDELATGTLYAGRVADTTGDCDAWRSVNRGADWSCLQNIDVLETRFVTNSNDGDVIYALGIAGLQYSDDAGASWTNVDPADRVTSMVVSPSNPDRLFVTAYFEQPFHEYLYTSFDRGLTWDEVSEPRVRPNRVDPRSSEILYAEGPSFSTDGGVSWKRLGKSPSDDTIQSLALAPSNPTVAYFMVQESLYRMADSGVSVP